MKNHPFLTSLCFILTMFSSCEESEKLVDPGYLYFPMADGRYIIYEVDSIVHDAPVNDLDTFRYFIKELNDTTFLDNENRRTTRIERYYKQEWDNPWQLKDIWTANRTNSAAEKVEENVRYVKLAFPVSLETDDWDGNALNNMEEWDYHYSEVDMPAMIGDSVYQKTCTVIQHDRENAIEREYAEEKFAHDVGMIYKRHDSLRIIEGQIVVGFEFEMRAIENGIE